MSPLLLGPTAELAYIWSPSWPERTSPPMFSAYAYPPQLPRFPSRGPTTPHSGPNLQVLLHESPRRSSTVQMSPHLPVQLPPPESPFLPPQPGQLLHSPQEPFRYSLPCKAELITPPFDTLCPTDTPTARSSCLCPHSSRCCIQQVLTTPLQDNSLSPLRSSTTYRPPDWAGTL